MKAAIEHGSESIRLTEAETVIGRGLECTIRFNDPALSRKHLRLRLEGERLVAEDLGSTNGTRVNGEALSGARKVTDGDEISVGNRTLRVTIMDGREGFFDAEDTTEQRADAWAAERRERSTPEAGVPVVVAPPETEATPAPARRLPDFEIQNCPRCGVSMPGEASVCTACGLRLRQGRPLAVTQRIQIGPSGRERRQDPRYEVEIPLLYNSETLTFDATARDLSKGGIFVACELLDPVQTSCMITLLPDGSPPLAVGGVVCHVVVSEAGSSGRPPGMGIQFTEMAEDARSWLQGFLARQQ